MAKEIVKMFNKHLIEFRNGSSSSPPDVGSMKTSDIVLWLNYNNTFWFRPYGGFGKMQILQMIEICRNEYQLNALMELLSAKKEDRIERKDSKLPISDISLSDGIERRELLKGNYRQHFLDWKTKYFRYKPKTYEYTSKDGKCEYTLNGLHKMYKRAMNESPFNGG